MTVSYAVRGGVTGARVAAADICADLRSGWLLDYAFDRRTNALDARDRRWLQELLYGMLRQRSWIDGLLADRVKGGLDRLDPELIDLLRLGSYQLLRMGSVPAYAAIAQTVELSKSRLGIGASKLVNAVLRRIDRERDSLTVTQPADAIDALALNYSHPRWLVARWVARYGVAETALLLEGNNTEPPTVLRPYGIVREQLEAMLESAGVHVGDAPLASTSIAITDGGGVGLTELGAFRQGFFHVQDPGATMVTAYANIPAGAVVADLCAAPGGKSFELARNATTVVSSDISSGRLRRVISGAKRLDTRNVFPIVADARFPAVRDVDVTLIDVPCTGTGTFRRHPDARWRLKPSDLAVLSSLQRSILRSAAETVKPGGLLVYSTCSIEPEENDAQIDRFLSESPDWMVEAPQEGSVPTGVIDNGRLRVLPQRHGTDGAFAARLRRKAG